MAVDEATRFIETVIDNRRRRKDNLPAELFKGEQGWDILLVLFVADANGERLTARDVLERVGGSASAGERWIRFMADEGLTISDGEGQLDDIVTVTPKTLNGIETWAAGIAGNLRER